MAQKMGFHVISLLPAKSPLQRGISSPARAAFFAYHCGVFITLFYNRLSIISSYMSLEQIVFSGYRIDVQ